MQTVSQIHRRVETDTYSKKFVEFGTGLASSTATAWLIGASVPQVAVAYTCYRIICAAFHKNEDQTVQLPLVQLHLVRNRQLKSLESMILTKRSR
jgi:hypothetical protein